MRLCVWLKKRCCCCCCCCTESPEDNVRDVTPLISPTPPQDGSGFSKLHVMEDVNGEVQELELVVREGSITPHQHQHQLQGDGADGADATKDIMRGGSVLRIGGERLSWLMVSTETPPTASIMDAHNHASHPTAILQVEEVDVKEVVLKEVEVVEEEEDAVGTEEDMVLGVEGEEHTFSVSVSTQQGNISS